MSDLNHDLLQLTGNHGLPPEFLRQQKIAERIGAEANSTPGEEVLDDVGLSKIGKAQPPGNNKTHEARDHEDLSDFPVAELIAALGAAIRRTAQERVVRLTVRGVSFRLAAPFITITAHNVSLFLRKGNYEEFPAGEDIVIEIDGIRKKAMFAGGIATLPGFDYDIVSFFIPEPGDPAINTCAE